MSTGYRNPPKKNQFTKGRSGNPNGRPRNRIVSANYLFQKVAKENVLIDVGGVKVKMTRMEAYLRQVQLLAYKNVGAARLINRLRKQFPGDPARGDKLTFVISESDARL